jgi:hypothetical protein
VNASLRSSAKAEEGAENYHRKKIFQYDLIQTAQMRRLAQ